MTNFHVIEALGLPLGGGERRIPIALSDGRSFGAKLVAFDRRFDVAVLEIDAPPSAQPFPFLELGVSKDLRVGEWALAVGAPLNLGKTGKKLLFFFCFSSFVQTHTPRKQKLQQGSLVIWEGAMSILEVVHLSKLMQLSREVSLMSLC